jgi:hypothetical protein
LQLMCEYWQESIILKNRRKRTCKEVSSFIIQARIN